MTSDRTLNWLQSTIQFSVCLITSKSMWVNLNWRVCTRNPRDLLSHLITCQKSLDRFVNKTLQILQFPSANVSCGKSGKCLSNFSIVFVWETQCFSVTILLENVRKNTRPWGCVRWKHSWNHNKREKKVFVAVEFWWSEENYVKYNLWWSVTIIWRKSLIKSVKTSFESSDQRKLQVLLS